MLPEGDSLRKILGENWSKKNGLTLKLKETTCTKE